MHPPSSSSSQPPAPLSERGANPALNRGGATTHPAEATAGGAFASLYRKTIDPLRRHLTRLLGNPAEAQDVAHDAYLRVYPKLQDHTAEKPEALLYTSARRLAFNRLKRRRIAPFVSEPVDLNHAPAAEPGVEQQVMARQELARLSAAIAALPPGCRAVLLLRKIELLPHQAIAARLGIAVSTVEKQHARALRLLRTALVTNESSVPSAETGRKAHP